MAVKSSQELDEVKRWEMLFILPISFSCFHQAKKILSTLSRTSLCQSSSNFPKGNRTHTALWAVRTQVCTVLGQCYSLTAADVSLCNITLLCVHFTEAVSSISSAWKFVPWSEVSTTKTFKKVFQDSAYFPSTFTYLHGWYQSHSNPSFCHPLAEQEAVNCKRQQL